jgi:outer membrane protein
MRSSAKYLGFLATCFTCSILGIAAGLAETASAISYSYNEPTDNSRAKTQLSSPLKVDDKYLHNEIPNETGPSTITLKGAVTEAATHNKDIKEASLEVSRFKWDYRAAEANRLPNIRLLSYLSDQTVNSPLVPARPNAFVFLSALFPVTQQYRFGLEARAIKLQRTIAAERLQQRVDETSAKVKAAYYKLVLDQSLLADILDSTKHLNELKITVADQIKRGNSLKVEEMEVAAKLAKVEYEETKARNAFNLDREKFNQLLGRELKSAVSLEEIPAPEELELNVAEAERRALAMRPEIRQADARVKQINLEKKIIISHYIPDVSVGVVYIALPGFNNAILPQNVLAPGIFINWNAWDWGRKAMQANAKNKAEQGSALGAETIKEDVLIDLHTQINKLTEARQLVKSTQLARAASSEEMRVYLNRYKYTSAKLSDALDAQSKLSDANNSYHQALLSFWEAKAQFDRAIGMDR